MTARCSRPPGVPLSPCQDCKGKRCVDGRLCLACDGDGPVAKPACTQESHGEQHESLAAFIAGTQDHKPWVDLATGIVQIQGTCSDCGTSLAWSLITERQEEALFAAFATLDDEVAA